MARRPRTPRGTQVASRKLQEIHTATHPAARLARKAGNGQGDGAEVERRTELLSSLEAEGDEEGP